MKARNIRSKNTSRSIKYKANYRDRSAYNEPRPGWWSKAHAAGDNRARRYKRMRAGRIYTAAEIRAEKLWERNWERDHDAWINSFRRTEHPTHPGSIYWVKRKSLDRSIRRAQRTGARMVQDTTRPIQLQRREREAA